MKIRRILFLFSFLLLIGCVQKEILDEIRLATVLGYDLKNEEELELTAGVPIFETDKSVKNRTYTESGFLSKGIRSKLNLQSSKPFISGKIEIALYNKELAEQGILPLLDTLHRDPTVGSRVFLAIVDGNVNSLLSTQISEQDNGLYLSDMFDQNIESGVLPETNLHLFLTTYYQEGADPFLPIIESVGDTVKIVGFALFKEDKMVKTIPEDLLFTFKTLFEKKSDRNTVLIRLKDDAIEQADFASLLNINTKHKYNFDNDKNPSKLVINLKMDATKREYSGKTIDKSTLKKLEKSATIQLENQANEFIKEFQELGIDPLGIGAKLKSRDRSWDEKKWKEIYPNLEIEVNFKVRITETGVID
ncbi:Ger(x)C family spore germination protein [Gracilibacillus massiliensis]|uniref:Ger(x)C family spore germination protein n=1 Tax=Gracilibacillus massiliensis TaxID=1564956 RepID=UPI00071E2E9A|nr:Ger(x)C family spore germination protein [Gracilibacillus massiliensis]